MSQLVFTILLSATAVQIGWWLVAAWLLCRKERAREDAPPRPVSVIICARNEAPRLRERLPAILRQQYSDFEVLVVDHHSTDDTAAVLAGLAGEYPQLRILQAKTEATAGKKEALTQGIAAARHDLLLLTDADCRPASPFWLQRMAAKAGQRTQLVLGYGPYEKRPGLLNAFVRFEAAYTALQYFAFALAGLPYMGVGRNLLYDRSLFRQTGGFAGHTELASGDDDLFVNAVATGSNTRICLQPEAFTWSEPKTTCRDYVRQKRRHLSTAVRYRFVHQLALSMLAGSQMLHYGLAAFCLLAGIHPGAACSLLLLRWGLLTGLAFPLTRRLAVADLRFFFPLLDLGLCGYYLYFLPAAFFPKKRPLW
ncbi:MAG: glycosyltransferase [Saprospiraceae bacterium]|nr:glycosyltransferase [Saprospiraceae bacterium]